MTFTALLIEKDGKEEIASHHEFKSFIVFKSHLMEEFKNYLEGIGLLENGLFDGHPYRFAEFVEKENKENKDNNS
jgi:hypothetical protein